jgi:hypothetical protein
VSANAEKWVVFLEGGGICAAHKDCRGRKAGRLGSAARWPQYWSPSDDQGILSNDPTLNPDFADWNHVFIPVRAKFRICRTEVSNELAMYQLSSKSD